MSHLFGLRSWALYLVLLSVTPLYAQSLPIDDARLLSWIEFTDIGDNSSSRSMLPLEPPASPPMFVESKTPIKPKGVDWFGLTKTSFSFLALEHGFRFLTEPQTRENITARPFLRGYVDAVTNLHGFGDGDPFYVNYVGHPMQGAVAGYIWQHNDRAYRDVEFGRNRRYWKEKLRGAAFSAIYSVQFEIGPVSEASIGFIQSDRPQVGFVDQIITPSIGLAWTIAEDWLDRDVVQRLETKTSNPYLRILIRGAANPARSLANALGGQVPWHRDDRPGVTEHSELYRRRPSPAVEKPTTKGEAEQSAIAPFQFLIMPRYDHYFGNNNSISCVGGQGSGAFRIADEVQLAVEVGGCKVLDTAHNFTSDVLDYAIGPRYFPALSNRWEPHFQLLAGGSKQTTERVWPELEAQENAIAKAENRLPKYKNFTTVWDTNAFMVRVGGGIDVKLNNAFSMRVLDLNYSRRFFSSSNPLGQRNGLQLTGGMILSIGTW